MYFPETVQRARHNSADLFTDLIGEAGRRVTGVRAFLNERGLAILLEDNLTLVFKFFGNRPNLLAFSGDEVIDVFNQNLLTDRQLRFSQFDRLIDQSYEAYRRANFDHRPLFPTFGKVVNAYLNHERERCGLPANADSWPLIQETLQQLECPTTYYLTRFDHKPTLSLLPIGEPFRELDEPMEAASRFYTSFNGLSTFEREKTDWLRLLDKQRKRAQTLIDVNMQRLIAREDGITHEEMGHVLMANLHEIPDSPGSRSPERVTLYDFYRDQPVTLKLKPDLSPQKNAENFYRKAKNEKIEEDHLTQQIAQREVEIAEIDQRRTEIDGIQTLKELRRYVKQHNLTKQSGPETGAGDVAALFKEVLFEQFRILIGRNAKNNDLLTQKFSYKEDLWLHARDVPGSHVLIKYQAGKPFPKTVIERAAELAAWYSKRRTDSLCPVTVTPKKYVRKPKGLAEGQVIVEKEDVVMVVPRG